MRKAETDPARGFDLGMEDRVLSGEHALTAARLHEARMQRLVSCHECRFGLPAQDGRIECREGSAPPDGGAWPSVSLTCGGCGRGESVL